LPIVLKGRPIMGGRTRGRALVSKDPLSFLGGVDPETGRIIEKNHDLNGEKVGGAILCFPHGHGSTVGSYVLYSLVRRGIGPKAIVNEKADPVVVVGAVIADVPMVDGVDISKIRTGDLIEVNGDEGMVIILEERSSCT